MCDTFNIVERLGLIRQARAAAEDILETCFHVPIQKAYELETPAGFDRAVVELCEKLRHTVSSSENEAVRAALKVLDVDWHKTSASKRRALIEQSMRAAGLKTAGIPKLTEAVFGGAAEETVSATRKSVRVGQKLKIGASFNALDKRIIKHLKTSNSYFIRDEYGARNAAFGKQAAEIVAEGLESGLGRDAVARDLERAAVSTVAGQGSDYWDVVAGSFIGRGRSFSQLSAYREARITNYMIEAVLDEVTTETCRFLHGKIFSVDHGIRLFEKIEEHPEDLKTLNPWVRTGLNKEGKQELYINKGDRRITVATVDKSGFGNKDDTGSYSNMLSEKEMTDRGIGFPPYHGLCRSTTLAVLS